MKTHVHVFIEIPALQKTYECLFYRNASFTVNLKLLKELIGDTEEFCGIGEGCAVYCAEYGVFCDMYVDLHHLNVTDGMTFSVY